MSALLSAVLTGIVAMSSPVDLNRPEDLSFSEALEQGKASASMRLRYEDVNQEAGSADLGAQAATARVRLGYETERYQFFSAMLEYTGNLALPDDDNYFDGSNGENDDAFIADPEDSFLSQYWLAYDIANTLVKYGRQRLSLDNGRFLGNDSFRQLDSSVRGFTVRNESLNYLRFYFGQFEHFNSPLHESGAISSEDIQVRYFNLNYRGFMHSHLSLYSYQSESTVRASVWDTQTDGVRFSGHIKNEPAIEYAFEIARQKSRHDNPRDYSVRYSLAELGVRYLGVGIHVGQESLGASQDAFFVSPLGELHAFQGWADIFTNEGAGNIAGGLSDRYATLSYHWQDSWIAGLTYHQFESEDKQSGPGKLGKEYNAELVYRYDFLELALRYADYHAKAFGQDTRKAWVDLSLTF